MRLRSERLVQRRRAATALLLLCLSACDGGAPEPPSAGNGSELAEQFVIGNERLGWTQRAPSFQELTAYRHLVYVDGRRGALDAARCWYKRSAGTYSCSAPLPRMTPGRHVLELTTTLTRSSEILESARSEPLVVIVAGAGAGAAETSAPEDSHGRSTASDRRYSYEPIATGLRAPTAVTPLPDGTLLIGERRGTLKIVGLDGSTWAALDASELRDVACSEIVLHGVALHPQFLRNAFVYVMYTEASAGYEPVTRVARFRHVAGRLGERAILLDEIPARRVDPGGAIGFGPDDKLYVATDDGGMAAGPSDPAVLAGKVLRLNDDGSADNSNPLQSPVIFAGLHRPAGLGWSDGSARPWLVDEALPAPPGDLWRQGLVSVHAFGNVSSACVYRGSRFPLLNGKVVIAQANSLRSLDVSRPATGDSRLLLEPGLGRIQVVQTDGNGYLYVGTGNTEPHEEAGRDVLIRLAPRPPDALAPTPSPLPRR